MIHSNVKSKGEKIARVEAPESRELWSLRLMVLCAFGWLAIFLWWFFGSPRMGNATLYYLLTTGLVLKLLRMVYEWYHYLDPGIPEKPSHYPDYAVDMLTTYCSGEPKGMVKRTLQKMVAVRYPHTTYLCDESNDEDLKQFCASLGIIHVTRTEKQNAKAGNINNALKQATGEICIIMDPDHEPVPEFLDRVLPYFKDPSVGYVQCVQGYYNQRDGFVARGAAEQTYHFYGPVMMTMNSYGTPQAIGANCAFRREALESIGGHAPGLTEDMHTSMKLQAKGWKALYIPEMLSVGLVPSSVSAFYKQQLKWARGTFELFFEVLPGLLKNLSWRQRIHHLLAPLHYLSGVVGLINILVPILSLLFGEIPWMVDVETFILFYAPLVLITLLIRQYSQKWLMKESERGYHLRGGILQFGTWWVYILGLIYSILRVNVPYIPTPKEGEPENNWKLVAPNLIASGLSLLAIAYGLHKDYNPYSIFMAMFALLNAVILTYFSLVVQQKLWKEVVGSVRSMLSQQYWRMSQIFLWKLRHSVYATTRNGAVFLSVLSMLSLLSYTSTHTGVRSGNKKKMMLKDAGGFYKGIFVPAGDLNSSLESIHRIEKSTDAGFNLFSFYQAWGPESICDFPDSLLRHLIIREKKIPMITWEPWSSTFPEFSSDFNLAVDRKIMANIAAGKFDGYLSDYAEKIRNLPGPVFIRFAHEPDNYQYPWSQQGQNTAEEYKAGFRHVVNFFAMHGVSNVSWVWNPWKAESVERYYPGDDFVDWVSITGLNYGFAAMDGLWRNFDEVYLPYRDFALKKGKPVMIAEFGSTNYGGDQTEWLKEAMSRIADYKEIQAVTLFYSNADKNWTTSWRPAGNAHFIDWTFKNSQTQFEILNEGLAHKSIPVVFRKLNASKALKATSLLSTSEGHQLLVDGKPFYMKGVAYNTGHDWQDGNVPLTKKYLLKDFKAIRDMGANTIRRYDVSFYDGNILEAADETGLKVIYGFWLDPAVDYLKDSARLQKYEEVILEKVMAYRGEKSVIGWTVGNESWGLLKHKFSQPYLFHVRNAYVKFVESMAEKIHVIDPERPVMTAMEHSKELSSELLSYAANAPSLDLLGINSYYIENIRVLDSLLQKHAPGRAYLVSEFGPKGYWNEYLSKMKKNDLLVEESDKAKADYYVKQWREYILPHQDKNVGGIAFCWHDRYEGTATWFGITDYKGRKKPLYHALQKQWKNNNVASALPDFYIQWQSAKLVPGKYHEFRAINSTGDESKFAYEWYFMNEHSTEAYKGYIRTFEDGKKIYMKVPDEPGKYRLYLYAHDNQGNVSTVSHGIAIGKSNE